MVTAVTDKVTMAATESREAIGIKVDTEITMAAREKTETTEGIGEVTVEEVAIKVTTRIEKEMTIGTVVVKEVTKAVSKDLIVIGLIDKMIEDLEVVANDLVAVTEMDTVEVEPWTETLAREEVTVAVVVGLSEEDRSNLLWPCHKIQKTQGPRWSKF